MPLPSAPLTPPASAKCCPFWRIAFLLSLFWLSGALPSPAAGEFRQQIVPVLHDHCFKCHNADKKKGGIDLTTFDSEGAALKKYKLWRQVLEQVQTEQMPPDDDKFTKVQAQQFSAQVGKLLAMLDSGHPAFTDPGPSLIRRLSREEYSNALCDLTNLDVDFASQLGIPEDSTGTSFDNVASALSLPPALLDKYFAAADLALAALFAEPSGVELERKMGGDRLKKAREKFFTGLPETAGRAENATFLGTFARRAWRRPVAAAEVERLTKAYDAAVAAGGSPRAALRKALKPVLVSPQFLFRIEEDHTPAKPAAGLLIPAARITDMELASRLSFFLWSSIPDDELLTRAEHNELSHADVLQAQVRRMLADPRAHRFTENFFLRWLQVTHVNEARPSTEFFPTFNDQLKRDMRAEVEAYCDHLRTDDRPVLDLLASDYAFVSPELAKLYGIEGVSGKGIQCVTLKPDDHRGGILGMGAVLASTSHTNRTSPTKRGKWVLEVVLGTPPDPPPANAGMFKDEKKTKEPKDFREKLAQHATDAACAGCHAKMDPLGFGLDNYNAIGSWRPTTNELDTSGTLPNGEKFGGVDDLKKLLWTKREQFVRNLTSEMLTYALGRNIDYFDEGQITRIKAAADKDSDKFSSIILGIVNSYPFQYRRNAEPIVAAK